jgi:hypothetical protein
VTDRTRIDPATGGEPGSPATGHVRPRSVVAICTHDQCYGEALCQALEGSGHAAVRLPAQQEPCATGIDIVLCELEQNRRRRLEQIAELRRRHPGASIVGLATYPRSDERLALDRLGVHVVAQPFPLSGLLRLLDLLAPGADCYRKDETDPIPPPPAPGDALDHAESSAVQPRQGQLRVRQPGLSQEPG